MERALQSDNHGKDARSFTTGFLSECKEVYALLKVLEILCVSALSIYVNVLLLLMEVYLCVVKKAVVVPARKAGKDYLFSPFRSFF